MVCLDLKKMKKKTPMLCLLATLYCTSNEQPNRQIELQISCQKDKSLWWVNMFDSSKDFDSLIIIFQEMQQITARDIKKFCERPENPKTNGFYDNFYNLQRFSFQDINSKYVNDIAARLKNEEKFFIGRIRDLLNCAIENDILNRRKEEYKMAINLIDELLPFASQKGMDKFWSLKEIEILDSRLRNSIDKLERIKKDNTDSRSNESSGLVLTILPKMWTTSQGETIMPESEQYCSSVSEDDACYKLMGRDDSKADIFSRKKHDGISLGNESNGTTRAYQPDGNSEDSKTTELPPNSRAKFLKDLLLSFIRSQNGFNLKISMKNNSNEKDME